MRSFSYQGHEVFYRREGRGSPIVFLHNGGTSHRIWEPLLEHYARDHDVIAMDMLGFGRSARPRVNYTLDLYVSQLAALLDELELEQVTLVGNCMGAATALTYAAQCPESTQTVIAVNVLTDHTVARGNLRPLLWITRRSRRTAAVLGLLGAHLRTPKLIAAASVRKMLLVEPERVSRELRDHLREASRDPDHPRVMLSIIEHIGGFAGVEHNHVPVPVCVIWGADKRRLACARRRTILLRAAPGPRSRGAAFRPPGDARTTRRGGPRHRRFPRRAEPPRRRTASRAEGGLNGVTDGRSRWETLKPE